MIRTMKLVQVGLMLAVYMVLPACHKSSSGSSTATAFVRVVNATPNGSLGLELSQNVNANNVVTNVAGGVVADSASGYTAVTAGGYSSIATANGLTSSTVSVGLGGTYYSVVVSERNGAIRQNLIADNQVPPAGGFASFNVANFSLDAGPLDIYVLPQGTTSLDPSNSPNFAAVNYGSLVNPQLIVAGTYTIIITANGNQADVRLTLPSVVLSGTEILTLALTGTTGGGLVNGVLIQQGSAIQFVLASTARVRVVAAFPPSSVVSTTVGATALADVASPNYGSYTLVTAGSTINALGVTGGSPAASLPPTTFAAGSDYTILVYGPANAWLATVFTDINQTIGSDAVLRLINAAVSLDGVSLTYNFSAVASNVLLGTVSGNVGVPPSNASTIAITSPGTSIGCSPSYCTNVNLESAGVYTYFVLNPSSPGVILSKDR